MTQDRDDVAARPSIAARASPAPTGTRPADPVTAVSTGSAPAAGRLAPTTSSSSAEVLHPYLVRQLDQLRRLDPLVRADVPDAVHQMRVAGRRLRSVFGTYRSLFDSTRTDPLRRDLKWLVTELGRPRDAEVLRSRIRTVVDSDDDPHPDAGRKPWVEALLTAEHDDAHLRATQAMLSPRYVALLDTLQSTVDDPPWAPRAAETAWHELPGAIRQDWHRLRKAAKGADRATTLADRAERLHEVRKVARRARYSAEAIEPAFGRDATRLAQALADLQTVLGDHHDDVVTAQKLRDLAASSGHDSDALALAHLASRLDVSNRARDALYRKALGVASDAKTLRWLEGGASQRHVPALFAGTEG
jgi:CHAD domain-containing protein